MEEENKSIAEDIINLNNIFNTIPAYNNNVISITSGIAYSELIRISSLFGNYDHSEPIIIKNSKISQDIGSTDIYAEIDMSKVIYDESNSELDYKDKKRINMNFETSKHDIKKLNTIKYAPAVGIIDDKNNNEYIITDGNCIVHIQKSEYQELPCAPDSIEKQLIGQPIRNVSVKPLNRYKSGCEIVILKIYNNQLECITFDEKEIDYYFYPERAVELNNVKCDIELYSRYFMKIIGNDKVDFSIAYDNHDYWLITESITTLKIKVKTYERLYNC